MTDTDRTRVKQSRTNRLVTAAFGTLFTTAAIAIIIVSELTVGSILAAAAIGLMGVDAIVSAYRNTKSFLSRIGPLP